MKNIAIIPARGGSKRIPGKNIRIFCGKPIIAYSIEAAIQTGLFDQVVVSTDDAQIAEISKAYGAITPFERPAQLSDDLTPTLPVVRHAIETVETLQDSQLNAICCIYATAPFLSASNLIDGYDCLKQNAALDFAISVTSYAFPIQRALCIHTKDGSLKMLEPKHANIRSQDLPEAYHDAGQFYWGRRQAFLTCENMLTAQSAPVVLPRKQVQDIDTLEDWDCAEQLYRLQLQNNHD